MQIQCTSPSSCIDSSGKSYICCENHIIALGLNNPGHCTYVTAQEEPAYVDDKYIHGMRFSGMAMHTQGQGYGTDTLSAAV